MRTLLIAICLLMSMSSFAGEILVKSFSQYELAGSSYASPEFKVNPEMNRAWVEINVSSYDPDGFEGEVYRVKIDGLTYNAFTGSIDLDFEGKLSTCAAYKTVGRSIFRSKVIKLTAACKFEGRWRNVTYDDGFEMKKTKRYDIFLIVE